MLIEVKKHQQWRCLTNAQQRHWVDALPEIPELLDILQTLPKELKNNHRSRVLQGEVSSVILVAKQPRNKNNQLVARVLSYIEKSEAVNTISTLQTFDDLNIASTKPLFALEKRVFGAVVDSWLCYEFRVGTQCNESHLEQIIALLKKIHTAGFRHNDPSIGNFFVDPNGEVFTIDLRGRKRLGYFSDTIDFLLLQNLNKQFLEFDFEQLVHLDQTSLGYRCAKFYLKIKSFRSSIKHLIKKNRPKNT